MQEHDIKIVRDPCCGRTASKTMICGLSREVTCTRTLSSLLRNPSKHFCRSDACPTPGRKRIPESRFALCDPTNRNESVSALTALLPSSIPCRHFCVRAYVCLHVCMYVCTYVCTYVCMRLYPHVWVSVFQMYMNVYMHVYMYIYRHMTMYMYM